MLWASVNWCMLIFCAMVTTLDSLRCDLHTQSTHFKCVSHQDRTSPCPPWKHHDTPDENIPWPQNVSLSLSSDNPCPLPQSRPQTTASPLSATNLDPPFLEPSVGGLTLHVVLCVCVLSPGMMFLSPRSVYQQWVFPFYS